MGAFDELRKELETRASGGDFSDERRPHWLRVDDGEKVELWFLQEFDTDSPGFDDERGVGRLKLLWTHPDNYRIKGFDTSEDDGKDWKAEQGWKPSKRYYINVLIKRANGAVETAVWNISTSRNSPLHTAIDVAHDNAVEDHDSDKAVVTTQKFILTRRGTGKGTSWSLIPKGRPVKLEDRPEPTEDLFDLDTAEANIPYERSERFYTGWMTKLGMIDDEESASVPDEPADPLDDESPW